MEGWTSSSAGTPSTSNAGVGGPARPELWGCWEGVGEAPRCVLASCRRGHAGRVIREGADLSARMEEGLQLEFYLWRGHRGRKQQGQTKVDQHRMSALDFTP